MNNYAKYFIRYLIVFFALLVGTNVFVDPFGLLGSPLIEGLNVRKTQAHTRSRIVKAYRSVENQPEIVIVGNSRVELGINTKHPGFNNKKVYNLGLPGADIIMQCAYAYNVITQSEVSQLVIGADFLDFVYSDAKKLRRDPTRYKRRLKYWMDEGENPHYLSTSIKEHAAAIFSLDALTASIITIASQNSYLGAINFDGQMSDHEFHKIVKDEGVGVLFEQKERELSAKLNRSAWKLHEPGENSSHYLNYFADFVAFAQSRGISVSIFISPYHKRYVDIVEQAGLDDEFERWKVLLAQNLNRRKFFNSGELVDFSDASTYTLEAPPDRSAKNVFMQWYWEPAHYRHQLGDKILDRLLLGDKSWGLNLLAN